jgi:beta-galactosidase
MLPHAGPSGRVFAETVDLGQRLAGLAACPAGVVAEVALVENADSGWALRGPGLPAPDLDRERVVRAIHGALWRAGITVDVVHPTDALDRYAMVFAPALFLVSAAELDTLRSYVDAGGQLVLTYLSAVVDEENQVDPSALRRLAGVVVEAYRPGAASGLSELVRTEGAEIVLDHEDGPLVTRYRQGRGTTWYVTTELPEDVLLAALALTPRHQPGVEVVDREDGCRFTINHTSDHLQLTGEHSAETCNPHR